jgi:serine/threonine-protein kinase
VLDDRFRVTEVLCRSGMASIFKATDLKTGRTVALKVPFLQYECDVTFFDRFQREEVIGRLLDHPSILRIIPVAEKSRPYIAMEYVEGQTLRQLLGTAGRLPVADALGIANGICAALHHMHMRDVVHRDLKPENIILCGDGTLRVMDFGIAKVGGLRRLTFTGLTSLMGTPDYMAPEQVRGKRGDERTDLYSLGALLYEMVTGSPPFDGANPYLVMKARLRVDPVAPRKRNPEVPAEVEEIILHALERRPADRYQSAADMKAELDAPETVRLTGRQERRRPPKPGAPRWRSLRLVALALFVPIVVFGLLVFIFG